MTLSSRSQRIMAATLLVIAAAVSYWPLRNNGFVAFDDNIYIYKNAVLQKGITWDGLKYAFSFSTGVSYWHPLTWLSLMLDYELFGLNPLGYHAHNLILHIINAFLLFLFLLKTTSVFWPSIIVAGLFTVHPMNVESVAWAVERKTVLSAFFLLCTLHSYCWYSITGSVKRFAAVFLLMAAGLLAKSSLVALPPLLLILDFWPLQRIRSAGLQRIFLEKFPLLLLSASAVAVSLFSHPTQAIKSAAEAAPMSSRVSHAVVSTVHYLERLLWPSGHAAFYPLPPAGHQLLEISGALALIVLITGTAFVSARRYPWFAAGWLWFLVALAPLLGLVRAGRWPAMADRFTYVPFIGLFVIAAWGIAEIVRQKPALMKPTVAAAVLILGIFSVLTWRQVKIWHDSVTLFTETARIVPDASESHFFLARALLEEKNDRISARRHFERAIRINSADGDSRLDFGALLLSEGKPGEALPHLQLAATLKPDDPAAFSNLASALIETGAPGSALEPLATALRLKPDYENAYFNRGVALQKLKRYGEAVEEFRGLLARNPQFHDARAAMAETLAESGDIRSAERELSAYIAAVPDNMAAVELMKKLQQSLSGNSKKATP